MKHLTIVLVLAFSLLNVGCAMTPKEWVTEFDDRFLFGLHCGTADTQADFKYFINNNGECPPKEITKQIKGVNITLTEEEWLYLESVPLYRD